MKCRAPYVLARACTRADEVYFHRPQLVVRLRALAERRQDFQLVRAQLGRLAEPTGDAVRVSVGRGPDKRFLGYVLRQGVESCDLIDLLYADMVAPQERQAA